MAIARTHQTPLWGIKVKQILLERNISVAQLAKDIGKSRAWTSALINGIRNSEVTKEKINRYLGLDNLSS